MVFFNAFYNNKKVISCSQIPHLMCLNVPTVVKNVLYSNSISKILVSELF